MTQRPDDRGCRGIPLFFSKFKRWKGSGRYARCLLAWNQWNDATAGALADGANDKA